MCTRTPRAHDSSQSNTCTHTHTDKQTHRRMDVFLDRQLLVGIVLTIFGLDLYQACLVCGTPSLAKKLAQSTLGYMKSFLSTVVGDGPGWVFRGQGLGVEVGLEMLDMLNYTVAVVIIAERFRASITVRLYKTSYLICAHRCTYAAVHMHAICVQAYLCTYLCMYVCMYVCMYAFVCGCVCVCAFVCMPAFLPVCLSGWVGGWISGWMHVCM